MRALVRRDLHLAVREGGAVGTALGFYLIVVTMLPLGLGPDLKQLGRIARLPELGLDFVKLDAAVVHGIDGDAARAAFVRGLVTLLHGLAITVVADGVGRRRRRGCGLGLRRRWPGRVLGQRKER